MTAPTQVAHPARAVARTVVQFIVTGAAAVPLIVAAIGAAAPVWLVPILAGAVVLAGVITRVMAIPVVNAWLGKVGLSAAPPTQPVVRAVWDGVGDGSLSPYEKATLDHAQQVADANHTTVIVRFPDREFTVNPSATSTATEKES